MSLKDALLKAGLQSTKTQNHREKKLKKEKIKSEKHQEHRNFCEVCEFVQPDVELFKHRMPTIDAEWICANCADKAQILDQFRITNQSEFSKTGRYRRFYGPMKDFEKSAKPEIKKDKRQERKKPQAKNYTVDEDGEKNFNC